MNAIETKRRNLCHHVPDFAIKSIRNVKDYRDYKLIFKTWNVLPKTLREKWIGNNKSKKLPCKTIYQALCFIAFLFKKKK